MDVLKLNCKSEIVYTFLYFTVTDFTKGYPELYVNGLRT